MTKNNISVDVATKGAVFTFTGEHGAAALSAVRAHQEIHAMGQAPGPEGLSDLVIPYSAVNYVTWGLSQTDEAVEDANCKVQTPEPETPSMTIKNGDGFNDMSFTLTLGDTSINGTYGDFTFTDGVAQAQIPAGGQFELTGIDDGTSYTISGSRVVVKIDSPNQLTGTTPATVILSYQNQ